MQSTRGFSLQSDHEWHSLIVRADVASRLGHRGAEAIVLSYPSFDHDSSLHLMLFLGIC
jgi:hypothetical protein